MVLTTSRLVLTTRTDKCIEGCWHMLTLADSDYPRIIIPTPSLRKMYSGIIGVGYMQVHGTERSKIICPKCEIRLTNPTNWVKSAFRHHQSPPSRAPTMSISPPDAAATTTPRGVKAALAYNMHLEDLVLLSTSSTDPEPCKCSYLLHSLKPGRSSHTTQCHLQPWCRPTILATTISSSIDIALNSPRRLVLRYIYWQSAME